MTLGTHDLYTNSPQLRSEHFELRLVRLEDAEDLLRCYQDPEAQKQFNSVNCTSDFHFQTLADMTACIKSWLNAYEQEEYVRFSIVDKAIGRAVGTIEMFGMIGRYKVERGILRLDIASRYENKANLKELFSLCVDNFYDLFGVAEIATRAIPKADERISALLDAGFRPYDGNDRELNYIHSQ